MASDLDVAIEKLNRSHERREFDCGESSLNDYLHRYARHNTRTGIGATYVAVEKGRSKVLAFYTISSGQVAQEVMPESERKSLPRYPIPVVRIGRLATDLSVRGQGLGSALLIDALRRAYSLSEVLSIYAVEVDALTDEARQFYDKFGFKSLIDDPLHLYITLKTVRRLFD